MQPDYGGFSLFFAPWRGIKFFRGDFLLQAILVGLAALTVYGLFLLLRGMIRLHQEGENKLLAWVAAFFVIAPSLVALVGNIPQERLNIWIVIPTLLLALGWISSGYFVESYLRREKQRNLEGKKRELPARPPHWLRDNLLLIGGGAALWLVGVFVGISNAVLETSALCVSVFLLLRGGSRLWRYRGF